VEREVCSRRRQQLHVTMLQPLSGADANHAETLKFDPSRPKKLRNRTAVPSASLVVWLHRPSHCSPYFLKCVAVDIARMLNSR